MILENLRRIFGMTPNEVSKEILNAPRTTFDKVYYGEVIDINDPDKLGRIKVNVYLLYDSFQKKDIPWAYPCSSFIGSSTGSLLVPPEGSIVNVRFQDGDLHLPIYLSDKVHIKKSLPKIGAGDPKKLIFWETDDNDYFEISQEDKEMTLHHSSGTTFKIDRTGAVTIHATSIEDLGMSQAIPTGIGHYCALPFCTYTGAPQVGNKATATIPVIPI